MSKVYFTDLRTKPGRSLPDKMEILVKKAGIEKIDFANKFTAIKIHFGEPGNLAYIRHNYAARLVKLLQSKGAKAFLTDSNTLYMGKRSNAVDHLQSACENGFNQSSVPCPVIIADGLKSVDYREITIDAEYCKTAKIGAAIADADVVISMTHFKGHEQTGFGGALKNLGMGSASAAGKLEMHSTSQPIIAKHKCTSCGQCVKYCASYAITLDQERKAEIDYSKCVGCGQCVAICQFDSARAVWNSSSDITCCKIAEYTLAVVRDKANFHISFIMDVSPECDCWGHNDMPVTPNIGIAASFDPVALDRACADLVNKAPVIANSCLGEHQHNNLPHDDKFNAMHPNTHWQTGLEHAEKIGLGQQEYELISV
ncbi:MAG: DUF362 domain-containing protein [Prevotellaceae bacterium]|jgi:uncharacterized Fe-S center protein|nr:DUF362 domain-containing protein [Prevotellaceae bacterium]